MSKIVYPDYNNSILNTITSILKYYNVESKHSSLNELDKVLEKKYGFSSKNMREIVERENENSNNRYKW